MRPLKWQIMSVSTNKLSRFFVEHAMNIFIEWRIRRVQRGFRPVHFSRGGIEIWHGLYQEPQIRGPQISASLSFWVRKFWGIPNKFELF